MPRPGPVARPGPWPIGLAMLAAMTAGDVVAQGLETRVMRLEQQVEALSRRLEALDGGGATGPAADAPSGGPVWTFEPPVDGTGFRVIEHALNATAGTIEILVRIESPLAEPRRWTAVGADVPLIAVLERGGGGAGIRAPFKLLRGSRPEPNAILHLQARVPVAEVARVGQIRISGAERTGPTPE